MKIFDFNIHLPYIQHEDVNVVIRQDMELDAKGIEKGFAFHRDKIARIDGANILLFNTRLFEEDISVFFKSVKTSVSIVRYTALLNFRSKKVFEYIDHLHQSGVNAIMFNSYLQQIATDDFSLVLKACKYAEEKKMIVCIDGSYGTSKMYTYDNMLLACFIADHIQQVPIVIVHSGGYRIIEAMHLAEDKKNVWLDTSFSLPYYISSSLEADFAFAYKRIGTHRVVFGSDHPYMDLQQTIRIHEDFFGKFRFTTAEIEGIFCHNALNLFGA
jgi:uncharacterized protein